ncbi:MAG: aminopeptidase P family protein [Provencibacterium sp.]|jgi:Xaa-Pro aminopeptidase|nr:aminopeptidase P family protein [Provencibacterium sp.]
MERIQKLVSHMPEDMDAVLIDGPYNRLYYAGMHSTAGTLVITRDAAYFIIDSRYIEAAKKTVKGCEVILQGKLYEQLAEILKKHGVKRIGIEDTKTVDSYLSLKEKLPEVEVILDRRLGEIISRQRMIKEPCELQSIRRAQDYTDRAFTHICEFIQPGMTEKEIALELEFYARKIGAEGASFEYIVVSGPNGSLPHGHPTERPVEKGDFITMDFGCLADGYCSDMTRTIAVGEPGEEKRSIYETVLKANRAAMAAIRAGVSCKEIDQIARDIITKAGYGECFGHGLGHSVGLEIHENPRFSPTCEDICEAGLIMTDEPGIYLEGRFGVRIEDMVYVTEEGCINLTKSDKNLIIL